MADMRFIPGEFEIAGVYFPPVLVNGTLGAIMLIVTIYFIRRYRLSHYFLYPQLVMASLWAIYTVLFSFWVIPS